MKIIQYILKNHTQTTKPNPPFSAGLTGCLIADALAVLLRYRILSTEPSQPQRKSERQDQTHIFIKKREDGRKGEKLEFRRLEKRREREEREERSEDNGG